jgi:hypothetical protein
MGHCQFLLISFLIFSSPLALGGPAKEDFGPPVIGRIEPFCGAVGLERFQVTMQAAPKQLQASDPLTLTIRIRALGSWQRAPGRPDLVQKPEYAKFREAFHIENTGERLNPDQGTWEFDYQLRPKSEKIAKIPPLLVVYFRPGLIPREKGFMTTEAPGIPLQVSPRAKVQASDLRGNVAIAAVPARIYAVVDGERVLRRVKSPGLADPWLLVLLAIAPPAFCLGWYGLWRRLHPDAVGLARRRRSRAAQQALEFLARRGTKQAGLEAFEVGETLAVYLRQRMDFSPLEPTPAEVARYLEERGFSANLSAQVADFFRACDVARFAPKSSRGSDSFPQTAIGLISRLEEEPCSSPTL